MEKSLALRHGFGSLMPRPLFFRCLPFFCRPHSVAFVVDADAGVSCAADVPSVLPPSPRPFISVAVKNQILRRCGETGRVAVLGVHPLRGAGGPLPCLRQHLRR